MTDAASINAVLQQIRTLSAEARGPAAEPAQAEQPFSALLKHSIDQVNEMQQESGRLSEAFEQGDPNVNLVEVMTALQKASIAFDGVTEVRNHLVQAYKDIMNMQV